MRGLFDPSLAIEAWFDEGMRQAGWFDTDLYCMVQGAEVAEASTGADNSDTTFVGVVEQAETATPDESSIGGTLEAVEGAEASSASEVASGLWDQPPVFVGGKTHAFVGTTSTTNISLTGLTGGEAAAPSEGDLVVVAYSVAATSDVALSATGFTEVVQLYQAGTTYDSNLLVAYKVMTGTPDTSITVSSTGSTANAGVVAIHVWRRVDTTTPWDVTATTAGGAPEGQPNPPAITPSSPSAVVLVAGAAGANTSSAVFIAGYLSNFRTLNSVDTYEAMVGLGSIPWSWGAYDPAVWGGGSSGGDSWTAVTLALRPRVTEYSSEISNSATLAETPDSIKTTPADGVESSASAETPTSTFVGTPAISEVSTAVEDATPAVATSAVALASNFPTFVGATTCTGAGSLDLTALTGGLNSSPSEGDLVLVISGTSYGGGVPAIGVSTPSGYTRLRYNSTLMTSADAGVALDYKVMGGTPDTTITLIQGGVSREAIAYVLRGAGVPVSYTEADGANSTNLNGPALDDGVKAQLVLTLGTVSADGNPTWAPAPPPGYTNSRYAQHDGGTSGSVVMVALKWAGNVASEDPGVWAAQAGTTGTWAALTVAVPSAASTDSAQAVEEETAERASFADITNTATASESSTKTSAQVAEGTSTLTAAETPTSISTQRPAIVEVNTADHTQAGIGNYPAAITNANTANHTQSNTSAQTAAGTSTLTATETPTGAGGYPAARTDTLTLDNTQTGGANYPSATTGTLTSDEVSLAVLEAQAEQPETNTAAEAPTAIFSTTSDTAEATTLDTVQDAERTAYAFIEEALSLIEELTAILDAVADTPESCAAAEAQTADSSQQLSEDVAESSTATDTQGAISTLVATLVAALTAEAAQSTLAGLGAALLEAIDLSGEQLAAADLVAGLVEALTAATLNDASFVADAQASDSNTLDTTQSGESATPVEAAESSTPLEEVSASAGVTAVQEEVTSADEISTSYADTVAQLEEAVAAGDASEVGALLLGAVVEALAAAETQGNFTEQTAQEDETLAATVSKDAATQATAEATGALTADSTQAGANAAKATATAVSTALSHEDAFAVFFMNLIEGSTALAIQNAIQSIAAVILQLDGTIVATPAATPLDRKLYLNLDDKEVYAKFEEGEGDRRLIMTPTGLVAV